MFTLLILLSLHFVGDFVLQSDWMALNKSKDRLALLAHVVVYSSCFMWGFGFRFALTTLCLHYYTDLVTSKMTTKLWFVDMLSDPFDNDGRFIGRFNSNRHWFFVLIGFDQLLHFWQLGLTYLWLTR